MSGQPKPDFDLDYTFGVQGESVVHSILTSDGKAVEVKNVRTGLRNVYVELEQKSRWSSSWKPSGISTTLSDYYVYRSERSGICIIYPTDLLAEVTRNLYKAGRNLTLAGARGDNPTRGLWVPHLAVIDHAGDS